MSTKDKWILPIAILVGLVLQGFVLGWSLGPSTDGVGAVVTGPNIENYIPAIMQNRGVEGAKIKLSGRLNGAEIARQDRLAQGRMPLQTLRANIDYAEATAFNTYGTIGIKVWIYKGEIFDEK